MNYHAFTRPASGPGPDQSPLARGSWTNVDCPSQASPMSGLARLDCWDPCLSPDQLSHIRWGEEV